jgi:hypothetical protein
MSKIDPFAQGVKKALETKKEVKTPIQKSTKSGKVKPVYDRFNFNILRSELKDLKKIAIDKDTTVTNLIVTAYRKMYNM